MKKLKAFTIIELCVVMLLSAIVTGIGFFTLDIFQGSVRKYKKDAGALSDITLLHRLLTQDIWKSSEVSCIRDGIRANGKNGIASYHFYPDFIIREKNELIDTFAFQNDKLLLKFQKHEISVPGMLADEISFHLTHKDELHPFIFSKTYGADVLMKYNQITK